MNMISRRSAASLAGAALTMPLVARFAHAAEVTWRVGHVAPEDTPLHQSLLEAADAIAKRSEGKMELTVMGQGRAGGQSGLMGQVRAGGLEMAVATHAQMAAIVPLCGIPAIGFLFANYPDVWTAMDGEVGRLIRSQIGTQLGLEVMEKIWDFGFRDLTTTKQPVRTAGDMAGLKIRTQIDQEAMDLFRSLAAVPVVISLPYLRMALDHRQVDGQEGMLQIVEYARLNEVQPYCAMTRHAWDGLWVCANPAAWKALPERLRRIVANTMNSTAPKQRDASARQEAAIRASLIKAGMAFNEVDHAGFRDQLRAQGYYARQKAKFGEPVWNAVQAAAGKLG